MPAAVEGEELAAIRGRGEEPPAGDAAGRSREDGVGWREPGRSGGHRPATGAHDEEPSVEPAFTKARLEIVDVALEDRADVGVEHRGGGPLVLAVLARDVARDRDFRLRTGFPDERLRAALMARVDEGEEEADGDRLDLVLVDESPGRVDHPALVQLLHHRAPVVEPPLDPGDPVAPNDRRGTSVREVVHVGVGHVGAPDEEDVAKTLVGDDADPGAAPFEHGVEAEGRAVGEQPRSLERGVERGDRVEHPGGRVPRRGRRLAEPNLAGRGVELDGVDERPADVHRKPQRLLAQRHPSALSSHRCVRGTTHASGGRRPDSSSVLSAPSYGRACCWENRQVCGEWRGPSASGQGCAARGQMRMFPNASGPSRNTSAGKRAV